MQFKNYLKKKLPFFVATSALIVLASCGSYQYVGYDNDGIYNSDTPTTQEVPIETTAETSENSYYKSYFSDKSREYDEIIQESEIFTDVDSYEGRVDEQSDTTEILEYNSGRAGWGSANNETIIIIDNGWNNAGWYGPWGWNNVGWGWNAGFGWGWNRWGLWNRPFWSVGFGAWNPWWGTWNPYLDFYGGFGWCGPFYNNGFYGNAGIAYSYGRRGNLLYNNFGRRGNNALARNSIGRGPNSTLSGRPSVRGNNNSTLSRPRSSVRPRGTSVRPRSTISRPRSTISRPRSTTSRPRSTISRPKSSISRPRTTTSRPRTTTSRNYSSSRSRSTISRGSSMSRSSGRSSSSSRGSSRRR